MTPLKATSTLSAIVAVAVVIIIIYFVAVGKNAKEVPVVVEEAPVPAATVTEVPADGEPATVTDVPPMTVTPAVVSE